MKYFLLIALVWMSCSKKHDITPQPVYFDSTITDFSRVYTMDADSNQVMDIKLGMETIPLSTNITRYYAVALHTGTKLHASHHTQPICRDSTPGGATVFVNTHNCSGGTTQIRIDSFIATPRLSLSELATTTIQQLPGDSFLVYARTFVHHMPTPPYSLHEEIEHGFFYGASSGYLLFSVNGKRFAALLNRNATPFVEKLIRIDP